MKKLFYLTAFSLFLLSTLLIPNGKALADASTPDSVVIEDVFAFRHVLEDEDQLYICQYTIDWTSGTPPAYIGDEYLGQLIDNDEIFSSIQPWGYVSGTADTITWWFAIYLSTSEVLDKSVTWASLNNKIVLAGNPGIAWDGDIPRNESAAIDYSTSTSQSETEEELETRFRLMALSYEILSGGTLDLLEEVGGVLKLTDTGETYFVSTLSYIRAMVPGLFADSTTAATFDRSEFINDYYIRACDMSANTYGANWNGQTFTPDFSYDISGAEIRILRVGTPGNVTLSLRATTGGTPSGADLTSGTVDGNEFSDYTTGEWETIAFDDDYALTGGTTYALVLNAAAGNVNNYVAWRGTTTGDFADGFRCTSIDSGVTWTSASPTVMAFACTSKDAETGSVGMRGQARLEESPFDLTGLAEEMGLSTLWMSSLVWLVFTIAMIFASSRVVDVNKSAWSILIIMSPLGWYTGFLAPAFAIGIAIICTMGFIYQFFFRPSGV